MTTVIRIPCEDYRFGILSSTSIPASIPIRSQVATDKATELLIVWLPVVVFVYLYPYYVLCNLQCTQMVRQEDVAI